MGGTFAVTGATGGIGYFVAEQLAAGRALDGLVADAAVVSYGLLPVPPRLSADGYELHLATAHLGHYALVARLLPRLREWGTRVVHVDSLSHRVPIGRDPWTRLTRPRREPSFLSYARSKVAVTLFALELAERLAAAGSAATSVLAHPGTAVDVLTPERDGIPASQPTELSPVGRVLVRGMHGKDAGAAVLVRAAVDPSAGNGQVWGPGGRWQLAGEPVQLAPPHRPGPEVRDRLLRVSEELTGVPLALSPARPGRR